MKKTEGITLISLVITIIILMILAGIATYSGVSSIKSSKFTKFTTELEIMQAQVNLLNQKYDVAPDEEKSQYLNMGQPLTYSDVENKSFKGAGETDKNKYRYFDKATLESIDANGLEYEYLVNVEDRKVIALGGFEYERVRYYTLDQTKEEGTVQSGGLVRDDNVTVGKVTYTKNNTTYKIILENVQCSKYVNKYEVKYKEASEDNYKTADTEITSEDFSFEVKKAGTYNIKITDAAGKTTETTINITD